MLITGPYSDAELDTLRELWMRDDPRLSSAAIGRLMNRTKNSVLGKVGRLGLPPRPSPIGAQSTTRPHPARVHRAAGPRRIALDPAPAADEEYGPREPVNTTVAARAAAPTRPATAACCWPIGAPKTAGFRFCDRPDVVAGKSYCAEHVAVAYTRQPSGGTGFVFKGWGSAP